MTLNDFLYASLTIGLGWIGRGAFDWIKDKRQSTRQNNQIAKEEEKLRKGKLETIIQKSFFLINDLSTTLSTMSHEYEIYLTKKDKNKDYNHSIALDNFMNIKAFKKLDYLFNFEFKSVPADINIAKLELFSRFLLYLVHLAMLQGKSLFDLNNIIDLNAKADRKNYTYIELEHLLYDAVKDSTSTIDFQPYYSRFRLYFILQYRSIIRFLENLKEQNNLV